jgi:hypothetical protein
MSGDEEPKSRDCYKGNPADLLAAIRPFAAKHGPSFCRYASEEYKPTKAVLAHGKFGVEGHGEFIVLLKMLQANLSFPKNTILAVLDSLLKDDELTTAWRMTAHEKVDWRTIMTCRWRNLCRVVQQGELKSRNSVKPVPWVMKLPWNREAGASSPGAASASSPGGHAGAADASSKGHAGAADASSECDGAAGLSSEGHAGAAGANSEGDHAGASAISEGGHVAAGASSEGGWKFCFDKELLLPVRYRDGGLRDPGLPLDMAACVQSGVVTADWIDGSCHKLDLSIDVLQSLVRKQSRGTLWSTTMPGSGHTLTLHQKVDRALLLLLVEQSRQVCMVKIRLFGAVEDERQQLPRESPVLQAAIDFLVGIATSYASGSIARENLLKVRDDKIKLLDLNDKVKRKPAAASEGTIRCKRAKIEKEEKEEEAADDEEKEEEAADDEENEEEAKKATDEEETADDGENEEEEAEEEKVKPVIKKRPAATAAAPDDGAPSSDCGMGVPDTSTDSAVLAFYDITF